MFMCCRFIPPQPTAGLLHLRIRKVDPAFGTWEDIREIADKYDLVVDLTVNHLSCESIYFKDYLAKGESSPYAKMFLNIETFLDRHGVELDSLSNLYRPRPALPFTSFQFADGSVKDIWTTWTNQQVDLDVQAEVTKEVMMSFILHLVENGADLIRLDAVGYAIKKPWTNSFLIPETFDFIRWLRDVTPPQVELLAEVHHSHVQQQAILDSGTVNWVYDFSLPLLTLHALQTGSNKNLINWIDIRPAEQITTLDTHDGIGVVDVQGLMTQEEINDTVTRVEKNGVKHSYRASGKNADNLDIYQINSTYYSALGEDDDAYIVARAIQFFLPGIPQVYYVGLLAGENDFELLEKTNHGRDVNRHNYTWSEIKQAIERPVVQRLLRLMRLRSTHPAFQGIFTHTPGVDGELLLRWNQKNTYCQALIDLRQKTVAVELVNPDNGKIEILYF